MFELPSFLSLRHLHSSHLLSVDPAEARELYREAEGKGADMPWVFGEEIEENYV